MTAAAELNRQDATRPLPDGWRWVRIGEVCDIVQGEALPLTEFKPVGYPVYGANGRIGCYTRYHYEEPQVLVTCRGATCATINLSEPKSYVTNNSMAMLPKDANQLERQYLRWVLDGGVAKSAISGSAQPQITRASLSPIRIPLPSLSEQKRIAGILRSQMAAVERARRSAEAQLQAAEALPAAHLRAVFNSPEAQQWPKKRFGNICEIVAKQVDPRVPEYGALPHVNGENIESGRCRLSYLNTAAEEGMISGKYLFESGDVLYSKLRPYLRKVCVVDFRGVCSADMYPIRVNRDYLDPHFTAWLLVSDEFTEYADEESRRARMPKLNRDQLFAWDTPLPSLSDQRRIASQFSAQMASAERLRQTLAEQLDAINKLPAALLRRAFSGEL